MEQISITTGKTVRYYPSLRDAARAMDIRLSDLSQCLKSNNNKKSGNFYWKFSKDYNEGGLHVIFCLLILSHPRFIEREQIDYS